MEEEIVGNTPTKVEFKAVLDTLAATETDIKVHTLGDTLSELNGMETFHTLSYTVAENEVKSLCNTQVEVDTKAVDYPMASRSKGRETW